MKVAILIHGGVDRSGSDRVIPAILWLLERLARNHEVHVYARDQEREPAEWDLLGARVHNIGTVPGSRRRLLSTFQREHRRAPFQVLHGIFGWGGVYSAMLGKRYGVPVVFHAAVGEFVGLRDIGYGMQCTGRGRLAVRVAVRGAARVTVASRTMQRLAAAHRVKTEL